MIENDLIKRIKMPSTYSGKRVDVALAKLLPSLTRVQIKRLLHNNNILINEKSTKPSKIISGGEIVNVILPPPEKLDLLPENIDIEFIYEDKDIVVLNKPPGISVHPGAGIKSGTLVNALLHRCKDLSGIGGVIRPGIVHRLDKDTSGIMVVAKNDIAHQKLVEQFKARLVKKRYLALIVGKPKDEKGTISLPLGRHKTNRIKISSITNRSKEAVTNWKVLKKFNKLSYIQAEPLTGRTHQIRVHLSESGYPIVGDKLYGINKYSDKYLKLISTKASRQMLHAYSLSFNHPVTNDFVTFNAPLSPDFEKVLSYIESNE